jgi:hypothetical protein
MIHKSGEQCQEPAPTVCPVAPLQSHLPMCSSADAGAGGGFSVDSPI